MPARNPTDWIALNLLLPLGPLRVRRLLARIGDPGKIAFDLPVRAIAELAGVRARGLAEIEKVRRTLARQAEREARRARGLGLRLLTWDGSGTEHRPGPSQVEVPCDCPSERARSDDSTR